MAEISRAEADVERAESELEASRDRIQETKQRFEKADGQLEAQQEQLEQVGDDVTALRDKAEELRAERIDEREAAIERVALLSRNSDDQLAQHASERRGAGFVVGLFAGFLLIGLVRAVAGALTVLRPLVLLGGVVVSLILAGIGSSLPSLWGGFGVALAGGLILSAVLMLARLWWLPFRLPKVVGFALLGLAAVLALSGVGAAMTSSPPAAEKPPAEDAVLVQEAEDDPAAAEFAPALEVEEDADEIEAQLEDLDGDVAELQEKVDSLAGQVASAKKDAAADKADVLAARDHLAEVE